MKKLTRLPLLTLVAAVVLLASSAFVLLVPVWTSGPNIPVPVRGGNAAAYSKNNNGWLYIVSGRNANNALVKTVQRYNVNTAVWDSLSPHPTGLLGAATTVLKDSLYIIGGVVNAPGAAHNLVYKFSINQNQWSTVANLPVALGDAKAVTYQDSLIYTAGGVGGPNRGNVYLYNTLTNTWRSATPFTTAGRRNFGGFAITGDTLVYMCGTPAFNSPVYYDSVYVGVINQNNRAQITWTRGANFPGQTRTFFDAHNWGSNGIIMTGGSTDNTFNTTSGECFYYSPSTNQWTQLPSKPTAWLTGQSGSVKLPNNTWKLICASGYNNGYLAQTEILTDTLFMVGLSDDAPGSVGVVLEQNFPNPFTKTTEIRYRVKESCQVSLKVFDSLGREVVTLVNQKQKPGIYSATFNAENQAVGVYFYTFMAGKQKATGKMHLSR